MREGPFPSGTGLVMMHGAPFAGSGLQGMGADFGDCRKLVLSWYYDSMGIPLPPKAFASILEKLQKNAQECEQWWQKVFLRGGGQTNLRGP